MIRKWLITCMLLLAVPVVAQQGWCPEPTLRLVNDYSGMLSESQRETLEHRLVAFNDSTSNQILVIITPTLHGEEIMEVGTRIGQVWGVGQAEYDNGLVILIKSKTEEERDGDVAIVTGHGLEGAFPDVFCKHIIDDEMVPSLADGDYYTALVNALDVIEPVCRGEYSYKQYKKEEQIFQVIAAVIVLVIVLLVRRLFRGGFGGGGGGGFISWGGGSSGGYSSGGFSGFGGGSFGGGGAHSKF